MTEELSHLILALTCPFCAGEGRLQSHVRYRVGGKEFGAMHTERLCHSCKGTGLTQPKEPQ